MGGFHGGHSGGGGGFHGGHSGGGGHYGGGGGGYHSTHVIIAGNHYYNGKRYYGAYYGDSNGKPMSFFTAIGLSVSLMCLGVFLFFMFFGVKVTATITNAQLTGYSYNTYETYDFTYTFMGKEYQGYGNDDANYENGTYSLSIKEGETYTLYANILMPSNYSFEDDNTNTIAFVMLFALVGIGAFMMYNTIKTRKEYEKKLAEIGDYNKDGKIDEHDIEAYESAKEGQNEGTYEGMKQATTENVYNENKVRKYCKYCGSELDDDAKFCSNCGASVTK